MVSSNESIIEQVVRLRRLLIIYEGVQRNEEALIHLLAKEIDQISKEGEIDSEKNFLIERLISEHNYPRNFQEEEVEEILEVEPFTLNTCIISWFNTNKS